MYIFPVNVQSIREADYVTDHFLVVMDLAYKLLKNASKIKVKFNLKKKRPSRSIWLPN